jgi:RNA methyltransferase, TrmH family
MITSTHNEKLKLIRKLHRRKHRSELGLFLAEGEDLVAAAAAAGVEPAELYSVAGSGLGGTEVEADVLAAASTLGSGTRVIGLYREADLPRPVAGTVHVYLHGVSDPGNVGAVVRSTRALVKGTVALGPGCADPLSPKAVRASMGSIFSQPLGRHGFEDTPMPRIALVPHGGRGIADMDPPVTLCLGGEREGLPEAVAARCDLQMTIPQLPSAESLNVAAAAAIALHRIKETARHA